MSPIDHHSGFRSPSTLTQVWRGVIEAVWRVEHAFERSKAEGKAIDDARLRIFLILMLFSLAFVALGVEAGKRALFSHFGPGGVDADAPAEARADLVDRNGALLAIDAPHYALYLDPRDIAAGHEDETREDLIGALPNLPADRLDKALKTGHRLLLMSGLSRQERDLVHDLGRPGVEFQEDPKRTYPLGAEAAHIIGFADTSGHGLAGAERALDGDIRAAAAQQGSVPLSIDLRVQGALDDELRKAVAKFRALGGVGLVVNVKTGEILAYSSQPDFDPNAPGKASADQMVNRGAASVYELGSVFKGFTLAAGLDSGIVNINSTFDVSHPLMLGGRPIHDFDKGDTVLPLWKVFTHSSNIGAAKLAIQAGPERMQTYFRRFGLFNAAPSELAESARPILPRQFNNDTLAQIAFGQGIAVTPLTLATGYRSLLDGGVYSPLTIRKNETGAPPQGTRVISEKTSVAMLQLMRLNVTQGSGAKAEVPGLFVGGKTGSAQKPDHGHYSKQNISSFVAVFPATGPVGADRYMVQITLDAPQTTPDSMGFITGGWNAAPTAGLVINRIAPFLGVKRAPIVTALEPTVPPPGSDAQ